MSLEVEGSNEAAGMRQSETTIDGLINDGLDIE